MRHFHGLLFLGAGQMSVNGRHHLHRILDRALDISGGLQQPDPVTEPRHPDADEFERRMQCDLEDAVRDLSAALLGREVHFGEVLPYPPPSQDCDLPPTGGFRDARDRTLDKLSAACKERNIAEVQRLARMALTWK